MPRAALAAIPVATSLIAILAVQSCGHTETAGSAAPNNRYGATAGAPSSVARMEPAQDAAPTYGYGAPPPRGEPIDVRRSARGAADAGAPAEAGPSARFEQSSEISEVTDPAPPGALFSDVEREDAGLKARGPLGTFQEGLATMRGAEFAGRATATGEWFDLDAPMASHPSLPLPSLAEIVNLENGRRMVVRINDRQPGAGEEVEVSRLVANELGLSATPAPVSVRYLGPAPAAAGSSAGGGPAAPLGVVQPASYDGAPRLRAGYVVQVGAFGSLANAERLRAALEGAGAVQVEPTEAGGAALYRVRVGPWADRADAEAMRRRLVVSGFPNAIVRAR